MASTCISTCVKDGRDPRVPVRATYVNLYKWPESDAEFIKSVRGTGKGHPRVVDSISCRQMYLRSYTFSRKEEKTQKCFGRVKDKVTNHKKKEKARRRTRRRGNRCLVFWKVKQFSCKFFYRLLSCGASVDVFDSGID